MNKQLKNKKQEKLDELNKEIESKKRAIESLKSSIKVLSKKEEILLSKPQKNSESNESEVKQLYDNIIGFESVSELFDGVKNEIPNLEKYNADMLKNRFVFGIFGNFNRGKTYLISKICELQLPSGFTIHTRGLSLKFCGETIALIDSAGFGTPFKIFQNQSAKTKDTLKAQNERIQNTMIDLTHTELFIQKFIAEQSNILVLVLGKLCFSEQLLKNRLDRLYPEKEIFVIHNLIHLSEINDVKNYIETTLKGAFNLREETFAEANSQSNQIFYIEKIGSDMNAKARVHFIIAQEGSNAGNYYNKSTFAFFYNKVMSISERKKFDMGKLVDLFFKEKQKDIFEPKVENNKLVYPNDKRTQKRVFVNEVGMATNNNSYKHLMYREGEYLVIQLEVTYLILDESLKIEKIKQDSNIYIKVTGKRQVDPLKCSSIFSENMDDNSKIFNTISDNFDNNETFMYETKVAVKDYIPTGEPNGDYRDGLLILKYKLAI
jgi:hypothetical protein